jgi:hypothetical protein
VTGPPLPHPLLLDPTPVWPELPEGDGSRLSRGVLLGIALACIPWGFALWLVWLWWTG